MSLFDLTPADHAAAAAHAAWAAQEAAKTGLPADNPVREVKVVAIIGAGTMGGGIAMVCANAGQTVWLIDTDAPAVERGLARVRENYAGSVKRGKLTEAEVAERLARIHGTVRLEDAAPADLFIEAVFEDMGLKLDLMRRMDAVAKPGAILATNTSGLDIDAMAAATTRPGDVIGAHFFSPAHVMRLLEVVRAKHTRDDVIATLMHLGRTWGKTTVLARVYPGFIGNACFRAYHREAHFLAEDGALPHEIDAALTKVGFAMGVYAVQDLAGLDVGYQTRKAQVATRDPNRRWPDMILKMVEMGRTGLKVGKGWYRYESGSRTPLRDPEVEAFIVAESARLGLQRRTISEDEILQRCLFAMVNQGARLLEEGIALRASDIDTVFLTGYGFPAGQGGPMFMADRIGLNVVLEAVRRFHAEYGVWWEPAPLLVRLAGEGSSFASWQAGR